MDSQVRDSTADVIPSKDAGIEQCTNVPTRSPEPLPEVEPSREVDGGVGILNGPIVGAITATSAKVWVRSTVESDWRVEVWSVEVPESVLSFEGPRLARAHDFIGVIDVTGLSASTRYAYRVMFVNDDLDAGVDSGIKGSFRTLGARDRAGRLRFAVGADIKGGGRQPIFSDLRAVDPDFVLLIGDQAYMDTQTPDYLGYASKYASNWNIQYLRELMTHVPTFMIWDDHDIIDNYFAGRSPRYEPARMAYELFVHAHNPPAWDPGTLYYAFDAGDVSFFVLDVRSYRGDFRASDGTDKTMLGAEQLGALFDWLRCTTARVKVIVSPVPFSDWADSNDAWKGYAFERDRIFAFIADHDVEDVLLITGDQHWSAVFVEQRYGRQYVEFLPTPLSKTRLAGPTAPTSSIVARDDDHFVFGVVDIDTTVEPATIDLTLCAEGLPCVPGQERDPGSALDQPPESDNVPYTLHFTTDDLGAR